MNFLKRLPVLSMSLVLGLTLGVVSANAQGLGVASGPAEYPPASFKGKQYVDSRGCAFIRAGLGQRVNWVPRVSRSRELLCGFRPTFAKVAPRREVNQAAPARTRVVQTRPAAKKVVRKAVAPQTTRVVRVVKAPPAPKINPRAVATPAVKAKDKRLAPCAGVSEFSAQFMNKGARCGPQKQSPTTIIRREVGPLGDARGVVRSNTALSDATLIGPKRTPARIARARAIKPPKGYRNAHKDGRDNPMRAVGTVAGKRQMAAVWSNTIPRYLIDPSTGKRID